MKSGGFHKINGLERNVQSPKNQADLARILGILGDWVDITGCDCVQCYSYHLLVPVPGEGGKR